MACWGAGGHAGHILADRLFGLWLIALLYLVTEELLVEAHEGGKETPFATAMFFAGFLLLLLLEEGLG